MPADQGDERDSDRADPSTRTVSLDTWLGC
jgi:hypothetical protein